VVALELRKRNDGFIAPTPDNASLMILQRYCVLSPDGAGLLVIKHRAGIAHVEPIAARFRFPKRLRRVTNLETHRTICALFIADKQE